MALARVSKLVTNSLIFLASYLYVQIVICPYHILLALILGRASPYDATGSVCRIFGVKFVRTADSKPIDQKALFLCNHRSWADFFIDQVITGGGTYLSRYMVVLACPVSSFYAWLVYSTAFFHRKKGVNRDFLSKMLAKKWSTKPENGLIVYPEGTRNQKFEPLKLKTGVIQMAYEHKKPVQCVVTKNKEDVLNERTLTCNYGTICVTSISESISPSDYNTFQDFVTAVRTKFEQTWIDAYESKVETELTYEPPFGLPRPKSEPLPRNDRLWLARSVCALAAYLLLMR